MYLKLNLCETGSSVTVNVVLVKSGNRVFVRTCFGALHFEAIWKIRKKKSCWFDLSRKRV